MSTILLIVLVVVLTSFYLFATKIAGALSDIRKNQIEDSKEIKEIKGILEMSEIKSFD